MKAAQRADGPGVEAPSKPAAEAAEPPKTARNLALDGLPSAQAQAGAPFSERAPWYVRNSQRLIRSAVLAVLGASALLAYLGWRTYGPSPLDEVKLSARPVAAPAAPPVGRGAPPPAPAAAPKPAVAPKAAAAPKPRPQRSPGRSMESPAPAASPLQRSVAPVTHTRRAGGAASAAAVPAPESQDRPRPAQPSCSEPVAALGLCSPGTQEKDR